ncbi:MULTISPECIES: hypothetical protein [unclassified Mesorhizobium]|uniref:hypothetical protein n=1 Tax=unclassified Mesorhizobium TaxID=325217 RepID=UPI0013DFAEF5|nr:MULTISPECIES: hypothetical protein [unclassified Mesorhizobium]
MAEKHRMADEKARNEATEALAEPDQAASKDSERQQQQIAVAWGVAASTFGIGARLS